MPVFLTSFHHDFSSTRYISAVQEWVAWVKSSPQQRREFYTNQHLPTVVKRWKFSFLKLSCQSVWKFEYKTEVIFCWYSTYDSGNFQRTLPLLQFFWFNIPYTGFCFSNILCILIRINFLLILRRRIYFVPRNKCYNVF